VQIHSHLIYMWMDRHHVPHWYITVKIDQHSTKSTCIIPVQPPTCFPPGIEQDNYLKSESYSVDQNKMHARNNFRALTNCKWYT
jgi:hypothetical protein